MGDLSGSSPGKRESEDKARWKGPVLVCGGSRQIRGVTVWYQSQPLVQPVCLARMLGPYGWWGGYCAISLAKPLLGRSGQGGEEMSHIGRREEGFEASLKDLIGTIHTNKVHLPF